MFPPPLPSNHQRIRYRVVNGLWGHWMKLATLSIAGFRSVAQISTLHVGAPTLLAGHNDAGKSSILDAVRFLLDDMTITERDRTFESPIGLPLPGETAPRVRETWAEGTFKLSDNEQSTLSIASPLRLRRISIDGAPAF